MLVQVLVRVEFLEGGRIILQDVIRDAHGVRGETRSQCSPGCPRTLTVYLNLPTKEFQIATDS